MREPLWARIERVVGIIAFLPVLAFFLLMYALGRGWR